MRYYPVFLDLRGKKCVIVGGGKVAERKAAKLIEAGASLTIVSPHITAGLKEMKTSISASISASVNASGSTPVSFHHLERKYTIGDLDGAFLSIIATGDAGLNEEIAADCEGLVNVVTESASNPGLCNFIVPSSINRGDLCIAVSTNGVSPGLSRSIRLELESLYPEDFSDYLAFLKTFREKVLSLGASSSADYDKRRALLKEAGSSDAIKAIREGAMETVEEQLQKRLDIRSSEL